MATVTLNPSFHSGTFPNGNSVTGTNGAATTIAAAAAGNVGWTSLTARPNAVSPALVLASPQIVLTGQGTAVGDFLFISNSFGTISDQTLNLQAFTWINTTTALAVVSATSTVLTVGSSPATAGFTATGMIQVFHDTGTASQPTISVYSYTGLSGSTFTGCVLLSVTLLGDSSSPIQSSATALTSLAAGDKVVQFWRPVANAVVTSAYFTITAGAAPGFGAVSSINSNDASIYAKLPGVTTSPDPLTTPNTSYLIAEEGSGSPPVLGSGNPGTYLSASSVPQATKGWVYQNALTGVVPVSAPDFGAWAQTQHILGAVVPAWNGTGVLGHIRYGTAQMVVTYETPPTTTLTVGGLVGGFVYSKSVALSWTYSDPQALAQKSYRVVVFNTSDTAISGFSINDPTNYATVTAGMMVGTETWGTAGVTPVYDSGDVSSAAGAAVIPTGHLMAGSQYRVFVFVTHASAIQPSPYPIATNSGGGAALAGVDFTVGSEPVLMPSLSFPSTPSNPSSSFNSGLSEIGPIAARARQNLLSTTDADQGLSSSGGVSVGGWRIGGTGFSSGTGTAPTIVAATQTSYAGGILKINPYTTTTSQVGALSGVTPCTPGEMLTATAKVFNTTAADATTCQGLIQFYSDAAGASVVATVVPVLASQPVPTASTTSQSNPGMVVVQAKVPQGAKYCSMGIIFKATISGNPGAIWEIWQPMVSNNVINILDDAPFATGVIGNTAAGTQPLKAPINAGWQGAPKSTNVAPSLVIDLGFNSYIAGNTAVDIADTAAAATNAVHTAALILPFNSDTNPWLYAADLRLISGAPGAVIGGVTTADAAQAGTTTTPTLTSTFQRFTGTLTPNFAGSAGYFGLVTASASTGELHMANAQLERVWTLTDGNMEKFTAPQNVPLTCALGDYGGTTSTLATFFSCGQWWQLVAALPSGCTANTSTTAPFSGTNCMILANGTANQGPVSIEQYFTVSGWTALTAAWEWKLAASQATAYVEFFDNANTLLSAVNIAGTVSSQAGTQSASGTAAYAAVSTGSIAVPTNAAYAHIVFTHMGTTLGTAGALSIDVVTITGTGTLAASTPWIDGGWSQGGLDNVPTITVERAIGASTTVTPTTGWTFMRDGESTAGPIDVNAPGFEGDFTDYEFPGGTAGVTDFLYYRSNTQSNGLTPSPYNIVVISNANGFVPSQWTLSDPLLGVTITLQVVGKVDIATSENQTVLMPMGRGKKVVLGDSLIFGDTITLPLQTLTNVDFVALKGLYSATYPLVLRSPDGEAWNVRATTRQRTRTWQGSYARPLRTYSLVFEEVDPNP